MAANTLEYDFLLNLIENVHHNKCLYDKNDHFYFNKIKRNKAWDEIGRNTKRTPAECKARWKILRERYGRELKKPSGCGAFGDNSEWQMFRQMSFLKSSIKPRGKYDNKGEVEMKRLPPSESEYSVSASYDGFVEDTNPILHSPVEQKYVPNTFASFADTTSTASTSMSETEAKYKTKLDKLWGGFGNVMDKLEQSLETPIPTANANDSDELFLRTMLALMKDLPIDAKDKFASEMFTKIMQYRPYGKLFFLPVVPVATLTALNTRFATEIKAKPLVIPKNLLLSFTKNPPNFPQRRIYPTITSLPDSREQNEDDEEGDILVCGCYFIAPNKHVCVLSTSEECYHNLFAKISLRVFLWIFSQNFRFWCFFKLLRANK